jgi:hypothetical protein
LAFRRTNSFPVARDVAVESLLNYKSETPQELILFAFKKELQVGIPVPLDVNIELF